MAAVLRRLLTGQLDQAVPGGQGVGHRHVVRFGGHLVEQFLVADDGDQPRVGIAQRQRAVVEAAAPAQPHPARSTASAGTSTTLASATAFGRQPRLRPARAGRTARSPAARAGIRPTAAARGVPSAGGARDRQQHPVRSAQQHIQHLDRSRLGADRHVGAHRAVAVTAARRPGAASDRASGAWTSSAHRATGC